MAKNSIRDYSATNSSNTDIQSIDISEGCSPAGINNAIREVMADLKDVSTGAVALESPAADSLSVTGNVSAATFSGDGSGNVDVTGTIKAKAGSTSTQTTNAGLIANSAGKFVVNHGNEYGLYTGYINSTNDAIGIASTTNAGTAGPLALQPYGGNVGIGTTSPASPTGFGTGGILHLKGSAGNDASIVLEGLSGSGGRQEIGVSGGALQFYRGAATGSMTESMRIDSSGNLLVGTTSNSGSGASSGKQVIQFNGAIGNALYVDDTRTASGSDVAIIFGRGATSVGTIKTTLSSTSYNTSSDYRLKTAVNYDWDATTRLKQLRPARFEWIADGDDAVPVDGFLAHEVQDVVPEAISGTKDAMRDEEYEVSAATGDIYTPSIEAVLDEDGNEVTPAVAEVIHSTDVERPEELAEGQQWRETTTAVMGTRSVPDYQGIDQSKLVPLLVKTIQELEARITALEAN